MPPNAPDRPRIIVVVGPTASGKSALALDLARRFDAEIVGADSMQLYRGFDIGTAKPTGEERAQAAHHMVDVADPDEDFTAERYRVEAAAAIADIVGRGKRVVVAGGTGLYVRALLHGIIEGPEADENLRRSLMAEAAEFGPAVLHERLRRIDPRAADAIHPNNVKRVVRALEVSTLSGRPISELHEEHGFKETAYDALEIGLEVERGALYAAIEARCDRMMEAGLLEETRGLLKRGLSPDLKPMRGLGYKEMVGYLAGAFSLDEAVRLLKMNTRRYAKRQVTWFKKDARIRWFRPEERDAIAGLCERFLS